MIRCQGCQISYSSVDEIQAHMLTCKGLYGESRDRSDDGRENKIELAVPDQIENENSLMACNRTEKINSNSIQVNYQLNEQLALTKKMSACDRIAYEVLPRSACGFVKFSTAAFEFFRRDIREYIRRNADYLISDDVPTKDLKGNVTQETIKVFSTISESNSLFTINLHSTTSTVMINGPKYTKFMDVDLPILTKRLDNMNNTIERANEEFKVSIPIAIKESKSSDKIKLVKEETKSHKKGLADDDSESAQIVTESRRCRRKKNYEDFEMNIRNLRRSSPMTDDNVNKGCESEWKIQPKLWDTYSTREWSDEIAKECNNKPKCCLKNCGKKNTRDMIRCDGCGRWCHLKCSGDAMKLDDEEDYICSICLNSLGTNECTVVDAINENEIVVELVENPATEGVPPHEDVAKQCNGADEEEVKVDLHQKEANNSKRNISTPESEQFNFVDFVSNMIRWTEDDATNGKLIRSPIMKTPLVSETPVIRYYNKFGPEEINTTSTCASSGVMLLKQTTGIQNGALQAVIGQKNDLFNIIIKQKNKILELQSQEYSMNVPMNIMKQLNSLVQALQKKEQVNQELERKNKECSAEVNEVKRSKKVYHDENEKLKNLNARQEREILSLKKQCLEDQIKTEQKLRTAEKNLQEKDLQCQDLQKKLDKAESDVTDLKDKLIILQAAAGDITTKDTIEVVLTKQTEPDNSYDELEKLRKKNDHLIKENTVLSDKNNEVQARVEKLDEYYQSILSKKDETIAAYTEMSQGENDLDKNFKRLLLNFKAEKELEYIRKLKEQLQSDEVGEPENEEQHEMLPAHGDSNKGKMTADQKLMDYIRGAHGGNDEHSDREKNPELLNSTRKKKLCWFGFNCFRGRKCTFEHTEYASPPKCRFDIRCQRKDCAFKHSDDCGYKSSCEADGCERRHTVDNNRNRYMFLATNAQALRDAHAVTEDLMQRRENEIPFDNGRQPSMNMGNRNENRSAVLHTQASNMYVLSLHQCRMQWNGYGPREFNWMLTYAF